MDGGWTDLLNMGQIILGYKRYCKNFRKALNTRIGVWDLGVWDQGVWDLGAQNTLKTVVLPIAQNLARAPQANFCVHNGATLCYLNTKCVPTNAKLWARWPILC